MEFFFKPKIACNHCRADFSFDCFLLLFFFNIGFVCVLLIAVKMLKRGKEILKFLRVSVSQTNGFNLKSFLEILKYHSTFEFVCGCVLCFLLEPLAFGTFGWILNTFSLIRLRLFFIFLNLVTLKSKSTALKWTICFVLLQLVN